ACPHPHSDLTPCARTSTPSRCSRLRLPVPAVQLSLAVTYQFLPGFRPARCLEWGYRQNTRRHFRSADASPAVRTPEPNSLLVRFQKLMHPSYWSISMTIPRGRAFMADFTASIAARSDSLIVGFITLSN